MTKTLKLQCQKQKPLIKPFPHEFATHVITTSKETTDISSGNVHKEHLCYYLIRVPSEKRLLIMRERRFLGFLHSYLPSAAQALNDIHEWSVRR